MTDVTKQDWERCKREKKRARAVTMLLQAANELESWSLDYGMGDDKGRCPREFAVSHVVRLLAQGVNGNRYDPTTAEVLRDLAERIENIKYLDP